MLTSPFDGRRVRPVSSRAAGTRVLALALCVSVLVAAAAPENSVSRIAQSKTVGGRVGDSAARRASVSKTDERAQKSRLDESYGELPISFEANRGQFDAAVRFVARGGGYTLFLTPTEAVLKLQKHDGGASADKGRKPASGDAELTDEGAERAKDDAKLAKDGGKLIDERGAGGASGIAGGAGSVLRLKLLEANRAPRVVGVDELAGRSNYFKGSDARSWRTGVANYRRARYESVYPGIDMVYYGNQRQLEYDFIIAPGASAKRIGMSVEGAESLRLDDEGNLVLQTAGGELRQQKPVAYQESGGARHEVSSRYVLDARRKRVGFEVGSYDRSKPLVIDPVLVYSSYLGGNGLDQGLSVAVDAQGNTYVAGRTGSTDFPGPSQIQAGRGEFFDAFIFKLSASGTARVYATYLGGDNTEQANGVAVDAAGNAYLTGFTSSLNFPRTAGALQQASEGGTDAFVAKIDVGGAALAYSTFLGGRGTETGYAVAVDAAGSAYVAGSTDSHAFLPGGTAGARIGHPAFKSADGGGNWNARDTGLTAPTVNTIAVDPNNPATLFAGTINGVFKSANAGANWTLAGQPLTPLVFPRVANSIVIDPANSNLVYVATSFEGVLKSTDGGQSYAFKSDGLTLEGEFVNALVIDPSTPGTLYAGTQDGVFKTTNGGDVWIKMSGGLDADVKELVINPGTPTTLYAATNLGGVFKTTNGGASWVAVNNGLPTPVGSSGPTVEALAIDRVNPSTIYAGLAFNSGGGIYKSADGGSSWSISSTGLNDGGASPVTPGVSAITIDPVTPSTVYAATLGLGVFKSANGGATWSASNAGLTNRTLNALAVDPSNTANVYVGAMGGNDAFVGKLNPAGSALAYLRFHGGAGDDTARGIAVDSTGSAYLVGSTGSTTLPTVNAAQTTYGGNLDAFVAKFDPTGASVVYSTYLGGSGNDQGCAIAVHSDGAAYVTGSTQSTDFPLVAPFQSANAGQSGADAFIARLSPDGSTLGFSTYFGGGGDDQGFGIALDSSGNAYVTGVTFSPDLPLNKPVQTSATLASGDAFALKLNVVASGNLFSTSLAYSTNLGGNGGEQGNAIAVDSSGAAYVVGNTGSPDFPVANPVQPLAGSFNDAFVAKISTGIDLVLTMSDSPDPVPLGGDLQYQIHVANFGEQAATGVTLTDTLPAGATLVSVAPGQGTCGGTSTVTCSLGTINVGMSASVVITVKPPAVASISNTATVTANEPEQLANNTDTETTGVLFTDLLLTNTPARRLVEPLGTLSYLLTVKNNGAQASGTTQITDTLAGETSLETCTATDAGTCSVNGDTLTFTFPGLAPGASATAIVNARVKSGVAPGTVFNNTATASAVVPDTTPANNTATASVTVIPSTNTILTNGKIAFTSRRDNTFQIYLMNPDGTGQTNLTNHASNNRWPAWSPDGTKLVFVSDRDGNDEIYVMNADGSGVTRLTNNPNADEDPTWSPDGTQLAFASNRAAGFYAIYKMNSDGTGVTRLGDHVGNTPSWSPDGARIAFSRGLGLSVMFSDGSEVAEITNNSTDGLPDWSPDGAKLAFNRGSNGGTIFTVNADGTGLAQLTDGSFSSLRPVWSPDGARIVFDRATGPGLGGTSDVFVMSSDGTGQTRLTTHPEFDFEPDWQTVRASSVVGFSNGSLAVAEHAGSAEVTVTRSGDTSAPATVSYSTADGTASDRSDYTAALGTLRFAPGETTKSFKVFVTDDVFDENGETVTLNLANPSGTSVALSQTSVTITIDDNDAATPAPNPVDAAQFFVRQHSVDFLNREPDAAGLAFWSNQITECGADAACIELRRINVSAAFFLSIEFQQTGYLVYRLHQAAFNTGPQLRIRDFLPDTQEIGRGVVIGQPGANQQLEANKRAFANEFVTRPQFVAVYPQTLTAAQFVDALNANTGGALSTAERDDLVTRLGNAQLTRAEVLRAIAEDGDFVGSEFNRAFVLMQYFGYMRRNPNDAPDANFNGYNFWLGKLNEFGGNFVNAEMVKAFITSGEYRGRFGQ